MINNYVFATPYVSGVIALMKSVYPKLSAMVVKKIITETAYPLNDLERTGAGLTDAFEAVYKAFKLSKQRAGPADKDAIFY